MSCDIPHHNVTQVESMLIGADNIVFVGFVDDCLTMILMLYYCVEIVIIIQLIS